jgi:hypothetical protein
MPICSVKRCNREVVARGWCDGHYSRWRRYGDVQEHIPLKVYDKSRTEYISKEGYRYVKDPEHPNANQNGWALEHRKVMADELGRPLTSDETVHHRNGIRTDNSLSNLELRNGQHGAGQTIEDKVEWAVQLISEYAPSLLASEMEGEAGIRARTELALELDRFRGRMCGLIESFNLPERQERAAISTLKALSYDGQKSITAYLTGEG